MVKLIMKKILLIEDDENIRELVSWNLQEEGYECTAIDDGKLGLETAQAGGFDLILLDLMLPSIDGYEVIKALRGGGDETPVIMLTAKSDEVDKILGLEFGADDYITKPFSVRELKARIKAVIRRYDKCDKCDKGSEDAEAVVENVISIGDIVIDIPRHEVWVRGKHVTLTLKEFELLALLARNRGIAFSREQLFDKVWGYDYVGETRTVDVHIRNLRKKLNDDEGYLVTIRGLGYKIS
jgi:two-component system alkaline phosphatase synthesis response regulator PhoP